MREGKREERDGLERESTLKCLEVTLTKRKSFILEEGRGRDSERRICVPFPYFSLSPARSSLLSVTVGEKSSTAGN